MSAMCCSKGVIDEDVCVLSKLHHTLSQHNVHVIGESLTAALRIFKVQPSPALFREDRWYKMHCSVELLEIAERERAELTFWAKPGSFFVSSL